MKTILYILPDLKEVLDSRNSSLEAAKARVAELESNATSNALQMNEKKRQLKVVKDEYNDQLQVYMSDLAMLSLFDDLK